MQRIESKESRAIIKSLKSGLVPSDGIERIAVGREEIIKQLRLDLDDIADNSSGFKFYGGDYGSGKTFMCNLIKNEAFKKDFIVSFVNIDPRELPMNRMEKIYSKVINGIRTKDHKNIPAFDFILQEWLFKLEIKVQKDYNLDPLNNKDREKIKEYISKEINTELEKIRHFDSSLANAIRGYYDAVRKQNKEIETSALGWIKGESNIPARHKTKFNVKGAIDKDNALNFLKSITQLMVNIGYKGLVIIFDELELIRNVRHDLRNAAYENIRYLCDMTSANELPYTYLAFAGTEDVYQDDMKGIPSYQALYSRIKNDNISKTKAKDLRAPLIYLDNFDEKRLKEVSHKVIKVHEKAYDWNAEAIDEEVINSLIDRVANKFGKVSSVPRGYLKALVDLLDISEQNPDFISNNDFVSHTNFLDKVKEIEKMDSLEPELVEF
ncbi:MAG: BREX system ATP-binding domain-containing protein [Candidatus Sericytochromatia bacterium]